MSAHGAPPPLSSVTTRMPCAAPPAARSEIARHSAYGPIQRPATRPYRAPAEQIAWTEKGEPGLGKSWKRLVMLSTRLCASASACVGASRPTACITNACTWLALAPCSSCDDGTSSTLARTVLSGARASTNSCAAKQRSCVICNCVRDSGTYLGKQHLAAAQCAAPTNIACELVFAQWREAGPVTEP